MRTASTASQAPTPQWPTAPTDRHRTWTPLGRQMRLTRTARQRSRLRDAVRTMRWHGGSGAAGPPVGDAVRRIADAVHEHDRQAPGIGVAPLRGIGQLVGLTDNRGIRINLLDLGAVAVHLLSEHPHTPNRWTRP